MFGNHKTVQRFAALRFRHAKRVVWSFTGNFPVYLNTILTCSCVLKSLFLSILSEFCNKLYKQFLHRTGLCINVPQSYIGVTLKKESFQGEQWGQEDRMQPPDILNKHVACECCIKNVYVVVKKVGGGLLTYDGTQT